MESSLRTKSRIHSVYGLKSRDGLKLWPITPFSSVQERLLSPGIDQILENPENLEISDHFLISLNQLKA